jgi:hypothetical protein
MNGPNIRSSEHARHSLLFFRCSVQFLMIIVLIIALPFQGGHLQPLELMHFLARAARCPCPLHGVLALVEEKCHKTTLR